MRAEFTISELSAAAAAQFGDAVAVSDGRCSLTFADLHRAALATAALLVEAGVRPGDRVGICMDKTVAQVVITLAVPCAGAILVPILPALKADNIAHLVADSGMVAAVCDDNRRGELTSGAPQLTLWTAGQLWDGTVAREPAPPAIPRIGSDVAGIIYSSGSTGRPKGIMISHRNVVDGAHITARYLGTRRDDRIGSVLSLNFDYGLNQLWQSLLTGARLCLHTLILPGDLFRFVESERITVLPVMPAIVTRMFDPRVLRRWPEQNLSSVRTVTTSGGPVSRTMADQLRRAFTEAELFLMYGLTEAFRSTYLEPAQLDKRFGSIGRAIPDVQILVLDPAGREVGPGEPGELVHRGGCIAKGYWNAPEATRDRFRTLPEFPGETVVFSGDIVTRDDEGFLWFVGRRDAMIKTSGFRVSPAEVEEVANQFAGVQSSVAFGVANIEIGADIALAYVVDAAPGTPGETVDEAEFRHFLRRRLPGHMVPRYLVSQPSFPVTGNQGKIDRRSVRDTVLEVLALPARSTEV
ncbi:AMP-binding protein [Micromonospora sp. STR1_7]|uniref:AMP-binding protein n=1 Tax=Micromonospora parastrephiae TaxID=2806101 RepID=A0ABS1XN61_9ACTN|nr:AMP-binding protein [Micromonospora parastrephiae]MBM0230693.1 AMP-binding protein [Micromonospora parastrephiae]